MPRSKCGRNCLSSCSKPHVRLLRPAPGFRWQAAPVVPTGYIAPAMFKSYWKLRRRRLRRKLSLLSINARDQLVVRLFLQATSEPVWGLHVVRYQYLFFAH